MNDGGIDGSAAEADHHQTGQRGKISGDWQRHQNNAADHGDDADADQAGIPQLLGDKTAQEPPAGDAEKKQRSEPGGQLRINAAELHEITAGPQSAVCSTAQ